MLRAVIKILSRYYRRLLPMVSHAAQARLLDEADLRELALYAQSLPWSLLEFRRHASHSLIGETQSHHRGRGFEFEENRAYQPGDEPRLLNWRLYARTGDLYTKAFSEERRPQVFLLVDRRAAMRFATRKQLKAALAAKIGACYAYQAQRQALAVGGLILDQAAQWFNPAMGEVPLHTFLQSLAASCPPLDFEGQQPDLGENLNLLIHRLPAGSHVVLISDFSDLDPDFAMPGLHQLATLHTLCAIQILDPIEQRLPASGDFLIEDSTSPQPFRIDGRDDRQQTLYTQAFRERQSKLAACFNSSGIPFKLCTTQDDVETCLEQTDADANAH